VTWFAQELLGPDDVVHVELRPRRHSTLLLVRRYDRSTGPEPRQVSRLHQEDLCQALGLPPTRKYQGEGGPSLADCVALLRRQAREPLLDTRRLLRWAIFNLIAGNSDGHAKNLSLLYRDAVPQLAPFYDLVCTRRYAQIDRSLAQSLGGQADPDHIAAKHFAALAEELSIARRWLLDLVAELLDDAEPALKRATARFREAQGDHTVLRSIPPLIRKQCKRTRQLLNG
jgi:serine/threonine-protein kinase HipA